MKDMELKFEDNSIEFEKELNELDKFVINFTKILNELDIKYVIISGYVAILFGRSRNSEDIDIFIEKLDKDKFTELWEQLSEKFECIIPKNIEEAYSDYLLKDTALRFATKDKFIPYMEVKFPKNSLDEYSLKERKEVILNNHQIFISPLELQIAYKIYLGSGKDIEDARFLYKLFKENLNLNLLNLFIQKLNIESKFKEYIE
ncbi:MAG: hypothetical protein KKA65_01815 [Nanoarchaeota archaeon]|nr:hypothetical protein [Nanoarchaeota archaeon]MBU4351458.1 hypothetical protein [Nanoarchaeota archaeon]MBU4456213.1 hypothetical protein [Nanoarchaeota archaeon]MCG2719119.1 hypothetical protein [Nanoarchaeota archaeon]